MSPDDHTYLTACVDCGKPLKSVGQPPDRPICLKCTVVRAAPEADRDRIRETLHWTGEEPPATEAQESPLVGMWPKFLQSMQRMWPFRR